jgi:hypothetical protein
MNICNDTYKIKKRLKINLFTSTSPCFAEAATRKQEGSKLTIRKQTTTLKAGFLLWTHGKPHQCLYYF